MARQPDAFAIEVDYQPGTDAPSRALKALADMVEAIERADAVLAASISSTIVPVVLLEDIEKGSIRSWFRSVIDSLPDDAIQSGEVKKVIGHYLVQGKRAIVAWADRHTTITKREEVAELQSEIRTLAENTKVNRVPAYAEPSIRDLAEIAMNFRDAASSLGQNEGIRYRVGTETLSVNRSFHVAPERLEDLLTERSLQNRARMLLKVKKPDFLGGSQWELRHGRRAISASIEDEDWLARYHGRDPSTILMPGDAISAEVRVDLSYGFDGELVRESFAIESIVEVVKPPEQTHLPLQHSEDD